VRLVKELVKYRLLDEWGMFYSEVSDKGKRVKEMLLGCMG
jgi:hypothetical protein